MLLGEPFWVPRAEIGELTDWHVWNQYIKPALQRNRKPGEGKRRRRKADRLPTREEYIAAGVHLGGDADDLGRAYDQWAASPNGQRALGDGDA